MAGEGRRSAHGSRPLEAPGTSGTLQQRVTEVIANEVPAAYAGLATSRVLDAVAAWHTDARAQARQAAVTALDAHYSGQVPPAVARQIADAVLDALHPGTNRP